jgi:hypothetical protein
MLKPENNKETMQSLKKGENLRKFAMKTCIKIISENKEKWSIKS